MRFIRRIKWAWQRFRADCASQAYINAIEKKHKCVQFRKITYRNVYVISDYRR
jgi:hypothetical protein